VLGGPCGGQLSDGFQKHVGPVGGLGVGEQVEKQRGQACLVESFGDEAVAWTMSAAAAQQPAPFVSAAAQGGLAPVRPELEVKA
jgi:hypothetical protein